MQFEQISCSYIKLYVLYFGYFAPHLYLYVILLRRHKVLVGLLYTHTHARTHARTHAHTHTHTHTHTYTYNIYMNNDLSVHNDSHLAGTIHVNKD